MLCTGCGKDIGDQSGMCPACAGQAQRAQSAVAGSAIGRITPNQRIVHLKPGETRPDVAPGPAVSSSGEWRAATLTPAGPRVGRRKGSAARRALIGFFTGLLFIGGFALAYLAERGQLALPQEILDLFKAEDDFTPPPIQVAPVQRTLPASKEPVGPPPIGTLDFDGLTHYFVGSSAVWYPSRSSLVLEFQFSRRPGGEALESPRRDNIGTNDPELRITMIFEKGISRFDVDKLTFYSVDFVFNGASIKLPKSYSKRLASFGEISQLAGTIREGDNVRGVLRDSRTTPLRGLQSQISWQLKVDAPLHVAE